MSLHSRGRASGCPEIVALSRSLPGNSLEVCAAAHRLATRPCARNGGAPARARWDTWIKAISPTSPWRSAGSHRPVADPGRPNVASPVDTDYTGGACKGMAAPSGGRRHAARRRTAPDESGPVAELADAGDLKSKILACAVLCQRARWREKAREHGAKSTFAENRSESARAVAWVARYPNCGQVPQPGAAVPRLPQEAGGDRRRLSEHGARGLLDAHNRRANGRPTRGAASKVQTRHRRPEARGREHASPAGRRFPPAVVGTAAHPVCSLRWPCTAPSVQVRRRKRPPARRSASRPKVGGAGFGEAGSPPRPAGPPRGGMEPQGGVRLLSITGRANLRHFRFFGDTHGLRPTGFPRCSLRPVREQDNNFAPFHGNRSEGTRGSGK